MLESIEFVKNAVVLKTNLKKSIGNIRVMSGVTDERLKKTAIRIKDYKYNVAYTNITDIALKKIYNLKGAIERVG